MTKLMGGAAVPPRPFPTYDTLPYQDCLRDHLLPNTPFLLSSRSTEHWPAREHWRREHPWVSFLPSTNSTNDKGTITSRVHHPNYAAVRQYGDQIVPVADTLRPVFSEFERTERPLSEVLDLWEAGEGKGLYVKDWHLLAELEREGRSVGEIYDVPQCFRDDWLNPPYSPTQYIDSPGQAESTPSAPVESTSSASTSDFRFTYLGPAGTFTPLHRDVYASYSWSANIVGRKMWWLFPPDRLEGVMKDCKAVFDVRELEGEGGGIKILQREGEVMFVPSGWYHQVVNIDFCISINHNFFSSPTLSSVFTALEASQQQVEDSLADVKGMIQQRLGAHPDSGWEEEWVEEVQKVLEMDAGWGWKGFWETVRMNLLTPPAQATLRPSREMENAFVREVIHRYQLRREWVTLPAVRAIVEEAESVVNHNKRGSEAP